ncbi:MAG: sugar-binding domain-containing protein, partial [Verrucomicrobiota bacterium]
MSKQEMPNDALAQIGQSKVSLSDDLQELRPVPRCDTVLSTGQHDPTAEMEKLEPVDSLEALESILADLKKHYSPFQQNLSPALDRYWQSRQIRTFDWRIALEEDQRKFPAALAGAGTWEEVHVPHYGEPLGRATTYYRTEFEVTTEDLADRALFLRFRGVDYIAHVFVNGALAGSHEGCFAQFEFDISQLVSIGSNTLLVRVDNDNTCLGESQHHSVANLDGDKIFAATNQGYNEPLSGWHHSPPGMGIYQEVWLDSRPAGAPRHRRMSRTHRSDSAMASPGAGATDR